VFCPFFSPLSRGEGRFFANIPLNSLKILGIVITAFLHVITKQPFADTCHALAHHRPAPL
jgi:hypothetical protein